MSVPMVLHSPEGHVLVYWPDEDCTTILYISSMVEPSPPVVSKPCTVRICNGKSYRGVTVALGMLRTIITLCENAHCRIIRYNTLGTRNITRT